MKALKLFVLAALLCSTVVVFSNPVTKNVAKAQKEVLKSIRKTLNRVHTTKNMEINTSADFVVYFEIDEKNDVVIIKVFGSNESIKKNIISILEENPVKASSLLKGQDFRFKLHLEKIPG